MTANIGPENDGLDWLVLIVAEFSLQYRNWPDPLPETVSSIFYLPEPPITDIGPVYWSVLLAGSVGEALAGWGYWSVFSGWECESGSVWLGECMTRDHKQIHLPLFESVLGKTRMTVQRSSEPASVK